MQTRYFKLDNNNLNLIVIYKFCDSFDNLIKFIPYDEIDTTIVRYRHTLE